MIGSRTVGCDPGGAHTGIVVRERGQVLFVEVVSRDDGDEFPGPVYRNLVLDVLAAALEAAGPGAPLAVEGVVTPQWFIDGEAKPLAKGALAGLMGTCMTFGSITSTFPQAIVVRPGKNGSAPLPSYPRELVGGAHNERWPRAEPKGTGILRHARSAWDVAAPSNIPRRLRQMLGTIPPTARSTSHS